MNLREPDKTLIALLDVNEWRTLNVAGHKRSWQYERGRYAAPRASRRGLQRLVKLGLAYVRTVNVSNWGYYGEWAPNERPGGAYTEAKLSEQGYDVQRALFDVQRAPFWDFPEPL